MTLETFFEKFDQVADAPDAVAKMRELVLQLAVRGQLVRQDPKDEPASKATERLLVQNSTGRNAKSLADEESVDLPFAVPASWKWVRFGDLVRIRTGKLDANAAVEGGEYPFFTCSKTPSQISTYSFDTSAVILAGNGDFNLKSYSGKFDAYQRTYVIEPLGWELGFCFWLISAQIKRITDNQRGSAIPYLRLGDIADPLVPFPPLAEQKRIVAKIDELMALCDRLGEQQQERGTRHIALARASLARFADAPTPENLNLIFHPSYSIPPADLRKSILTLAVQGKLVPQDPNDEPADSILRQTHSFFDRLVTAKKLSAPKPLPPIEDDEEPFSLPIGWVWCRFGQIMRISSGDGLVAKDMNAGPIPVYGGNGVNGYHDAHNVAKRTLVIGRVGFYCGSIHVTPERAWVTDNAFITTFDEEHVDMNFLNWLLKATDLRERDNATAQPVISGGKVYPTVLAIPPLAEQRRIVAKVEQLMALVDALETQLAASRDKGQKLLEAIVGELTLES